VKGRGNEDAEVRTAILEAIRENPGIKAREIRDKVRAKRNRANHDALMRLVAELVAEGVIENRGSKGRHAYFVLGAPQSER
jgi:predicted transcriptional regulator